jgi:hypothetical protein
MYDHTEQSGGTQEDSPDQLLNLTHLLYNSKMHQLSYPGFLCADEIGDYHCRRAVLP